MGTSLASSAAVAVVLVLIAVLILAVVFVLVVVLIVILVVAVVLILIVHIYFLQVLSCGHAAIPVCPQSQDLSLALNNRLARKPKKTAAQIPPAVDLSPPVKIPQKP